MTTRKHPHDAPEGEPREPATASLEAKIAELESAVAEARDRYLRLAADFDNYKKRARQEQMETIQHASADLIGRVLPVLDDLHSVLEHKPAGIDKSWVKGLELSVRKLEEALGTHGLQPIEAGLPRPRPRRQARSRQGCTAAGRYRRHRNPIINEWRSSATTTRCSESDGRRRPRT